MDSDSKRELLPLAGGDPARHEKRGMPATFDSHARITGPCGDTMAFWLTIRDGIVETARYETDGCGSSSACGNTACRLAEGQTVRHAAAVSQQMILDALGGLPEETEHCALLAANTLKAACEEYERRFGEGKQV
mgnify:CR=1 FL=1